MVPTSLRERLIGAMPVVVGLVPDGSTPPGGER